MQIESIHRLVVITGCQRSGTTLAGQIVGAHPNAFLIDEDDGLYDWFHATDSNLCEAGGQFSSVVQRANTKYRDVHSRANIDSDGNVTIDKNITHLVLKAPNLAYSFARLAALSLPVSVIFPQRDPRSVVASMTRLAGIDMVGNQCRLIRKDPALAEEFRSELSQIEQNRVPDHIKRAMIWRIKTQIVDKFIAAGIPTFKYDYEALVSDKKSYCSKMAKHVGLVPSQLMEEYETVYQGWGPGGTNRSRPVDGKSIFLWKETLTAQQAHDILQITGYRAKEVD